MPILTVCIWLPSWTGVVKSYCLGVYPTFLSWLPILKYPKKRFQNLTQLRYLTATRSVSLPIKNTDILKGSSLEISMDGKGQWMGHVFIESLCRSWKYGEVYLIPYDSVAQAKQRVDV